MADEESPTDCQERFLESQIKVTESTIGGHFIPAVAKETSESTELQSTERLAKLFGLVFIFATCPSNATNLCPKWPKIASAKLSWSAAH